jgi:integrase
LRSCFVPRGARASVFGQRALRDVAHVGCIARTTKNLSLPKTLTGPIVKCWDKPARTSSSTPYLGNSWSWVAPSVTPNWIHRLPKRGRQAHWLTLSLGLHLGYQRWPRDTVGRWLVRRRKGRNAYTVATLGRADDAGGIEGMSYEFACAAALAAQPPAATAAKRYDVRACIIDYIDFLAARGQRTDGVERTAVAHILPTLGNLAVSELTTAQLRKWLAAVAAAPARKRSPADRQNFKPSDESDPDYTRRRQCSANRVAATLRAALNHAHTEGKVPHAEAWGRRWQRFRGVDAARVRYLSMEEARRFLNACDPAEFHPLARGALETGCRYGELIALQVADFNADSGTVLVRKSKTYKARHVPLTEHGAEFFRMITLGRAGDAPMFARAVGERWTLGMQGRFMAMACQHASIMPPIGFHQLRHTWASNAIMNGVPAMIVARVLGHRDTVQIEKHYAHLAPSFITEAIRAGAPRFGPVQTGRVQNIRS